MKNVISLSAVSLAALALCGCYQTVVDSGAYSEEEKAWIKTIQDSYPGYTPPPLMPGAVVNNTQDAESAVIKDKLAPASDPAVEKAAAKPAEKAAFVEEEPNDPEVESLHSENEKAASVKDAAAAPEVKKEENKEEKAAPAVAEKAEAKAEVKDAPAAADKKAEVKSEPTEPTGSDVYVVKSGDTLGKIAQKAYGNARYSGVIFKANSDIIKNPNLLRPGMRLIIPKL